MHRKSIPPGCAKRVVYGRDLRLADAVRSIQCRVAGRDVRIVTIGPLVLFSTQTGDAWLLEPGDHPALPLAREGDPQPAPIEDTDTAFAIGWTGQCHIDGPAFVYRDQRNGRMATILGYPRQKLTQKART
jgi:hypothetical protein